MPDPDTAVNLECLEGKWSVRVIEPGEEISREFDRKVHAVSWASGQRIRLGLDSFNEIGYDSRAQQSD